MGFPWICGSGKNVPKHTTPALGTHLRSAKRCKGRRRDSKKEIMALPLPGAATEAPISHPLPKEERRGRKQAKERKEGRGERGRDGGEGEIEGEGEGRGQGGRERARQGDRLSKDQMLAKVLIRKKNF